MALAVAPQAMAQQRSDLWDPQAKGHPHPPKFVAHAMSLTV